MRVCHVLEAGGGVGQAIIDQVRGGLTAGNDVTVIYASPRAEPYFINSLTPLLGKNFIPIIMQRAVGFHDITATWRLFKTLRAAGPFDIIHAHSSKAGALVRLLSFLFPRSITLYSPHAFVTLDEKAPQVYRTIEKLLGYIPGAIITLSSVEQAHALNELRLAPHKLMVIPNGIQIDHPATRPTARAALKWGDDRFIVGYVGRFVPQKNPLRVVEAFALAAQKLPNLCLSLVGDGVMKPAVDAAIEKHGLGDRVNFFSGYAGRDLMPGFDCLLCASDFEGFALIFLEALAAGLPIIATPVGGAAETILQGQTGFIAKDFQAQSIADELITLASLDADKRALMSAAARRHVENFSLERVTGQMQSLYTTLLARKRH